MAGDELRPTREQVAAEPAGRRLDAWVHGLVMGRRCEFVAAVPTVTVEDPEALFGTLTNFGGAVFTRRREWLVNDWYDPDANDEVPAYSTDPGAAWAVVEHMRAADWSVLTMDSISGVGWRCGFVAPPDRKHGGYADTMALAVCRAAVRAVIGD